MTMLKYARLLKQAVKSVDYWSHVAMRAFVRDLGQRMDELGMKRADLARKIDASTAYVTKVMRGDANFTLETMTKLAMAVNGKLEVRIVNKDAPSTSVRNGHIGWHFEKGPRRDVANASAMLKLDPNQIAANEKYGSELQVSYARSAA
jgi:antitoxin component HigA of HigAB toxin-antitoxin module